MSHSFSIGLRHLPTTLSRTRPAGWMFPSIPASSLSLPKALLAVPDPEAWELFWMPAGNSSPPRPCLFAIPPSNRIPNGIPGAFPYHRPYPDRDLFLPNGSALDAALETQELDRLFPWPLVVFHPRHGPVAFEKHQRLRFLDLFSLPETSDGGFHHAHPGLPEPPGFVSAEPAITELTGLKHVFRIRGGRSGSQPLRNLPPIPGEKADPWSQRLQFAVGEALARPWRKGGDYSAEARSALSWLRRLRLWAGRNLLDLQRDREQEREFDRLLHLLRQDPDAALHYTPPVGGKPTPQAARNSRLQGQAGAPIQSPRPGSSPGPQLPAPPIPKWVFDWEKHAALISAYRQAANRELHRGRPLHAAYIYAELLHDYQAAASVLRQAGHFREAAALYQKHLGRPREAAECLLQGGLLLEAASLFEHQHDYLAAADAWTRLGDSQRTRLAFHRAVDRCVLQHNYVAAAHILESHLDRRSDAIALLAQRWPSSHDAEDCLREELQVRARTLDWNLLRQRLEELSECSPVQSAPVLIRLLAGFARNCLDPRTRDHSLDCAWELTARSLRRSQTALREHVLRSISHLAPQDRLLQRDAARYLERHTDPQSTHRVHRSAKFPCLDRIDLPRRIHWRRFLPRGRTGICGLGIGPEGSLAFLRSTWTGSPQSVVTPDQIPAAITPRFAYAWDTNPETLTVPAAGALWSAALPASQDIPRPLHGENPGWIERDGFLGMTLTPQGVAWVLSQIDDEWVLYSFSPLGDLIASHSAGPVDPRLSIPAPGQGVPMAYARGQLFFSLGDKLGRFYRDQVSFQAAPGIIRDLSVSQTGAPVRIAASLDRGVALFGFRENWGPPHCLPLNEPELRTGFTLSGAVIAALPGHIEVFHIHGEEIRSAAHASVSEDPPLAVFATDEDSMFAVVTADQIQRRRL